MKEAQLENHDMSQWYSSGLPISDHVSKSMYSQYFHVYVYITILLYLHGKTVQIKRTEMK